MKAQVPCSVPLSSQAGPNAVCALAAGGLLASINSYAQLFETLTDKASALEGQRKKALAEHSVVRCVKSGPRAEALSVECPSRAEAASSFWLFRRLEHMKLQATKFVLASTAAAQQARLIGLQLQQETDATALLDASLSVHQLHLRKGIAAMDLRESRAFAEGLMGSLASPARVDASGGEADALVRCTANSPS